MKLRLQLACLFVCALVSSSCSDVSERNTNMIKIGPDALANLVMYFKKGTPEADIERCYRKAIYVPRADNRGDDFREGLGGFLRLLPSQANNYDAIAISFKADATDDQRLAIKELIESCGIVYKTFENTAPKDIKDL
jgi:hypothetical protein